MTQLLISVKNVEESRVARYAGVDLIDLKDPSVGALGALDVDIVQQIVQEVNGSALIRATVGEGHATVDALMQDIALYASLGVDIVKIAFSELFQQPNFFAEIERLARQGIKVVVVFFADQPLDFGLLVKLQKNGFYGAMLDTQSKQLSLLDVQSMDALKHFIVVCEQHKLFSGLAGSVNKAHIDVLLTISPSFIGMRGGVCRQQDRTSTLIGELVTEVKIMLLNYNNEGVLLEM
jgi:(5-formylfuran-3-yl)methyl phosphate synthase